MEKKLYIAVIKTREGEKKESISMVCENIVKAVRHAESYAKGIKGEIILIQKA